MAAQLPDIILLDGERMDLYSNPLEQYWVASNKKRPSFCPLPHCTRGYIATWEILEAKLHLKAIDGNFQRSSFFLNKRIARYSLNALFPRSDNRLVKAGWFSGKLRIPKGKMILYEHNAYASRFEKDIIITVDHGQVIKMVTLDYTQRVLTVN